MAQGKVTSLDQFVKAVEKIANRWAKRKDAEYVMSPWFRGVPDERYKLLPGLYRPSPQDEGEPALEVENELRREFQLRAYPFLSEALYHPRNRWDWYFLMQHFGLKTRLLDWTESALVALYFATGENRWRLQNPQKKGGGYRDSAVWMMNPWLFNEHHALTEQRIPPFEDPILEPYLAEYHQKVNTVHWPQKPLAFEPPHNSLRLAAQRGKFTIHGEDKMPLEDLHQHGQTFVKIVIDGKERDWIRQQLGRAGITEGTLYPGLEGLARDIADYVADTLIDE